MASVKVKFRPSTVAGHEGTVYYQIIHCRRPRQLLTDYHIRPDEWDAGMAAIRLDNAGERTSLLRSMNERIRWDVEHITKIFRKLDADGLDYSSDDIIREFSRLSKEYSFSNFTNGIIDRQKQNGKERTAEAYYSTLCSFKKFLASQASKDDNRNCEDIMIDCLNSEVMEAYEAWLHNRGVAPNTVSFYTRILRAIYNRAVEKGITENKNPFRHVFTRVDKTIKRALPISILRKIKNLDLARKPSLEYARDMFLMSFYLRGMSFIDMAFLKKTDLRNGYVIYRRHKTGQQLVIEWTKEMQMLLDKYPANPTAYLLPIICKTVKNERCLYRNIAYRINYHLKVIAEEVGIIVPLTLYVARHSWASAAKAKGIPLSVISEGMGHDSETTTQIYLASLDSSIVDKANSLIIKSI